MDSTRPAHKLRLVIEDGHLSAELIHLDLECAPAGFCGACDRALDDTEVEPCYDCSGPSPSSECWIQGWIDNGCPEDYMRGRVEIEVPFDARYDEGLLAIVGWPLGPEQ